MGSLRGFHSAFWVRAIVHIHSVLGVVWSSRAGGRWLASFLTPCGFSEFILGDVEGGSLLRVPCSDPEPAHPSLISGLQGGEVTLALVDPSLLACRSSVCENSIKAALSVVKG